MIIIAYPAHQAQEQALEPAYTAHQHFGGLPKDRPHIV